MENLGNVFTDVFWEFSWLVGGRSLRLGGVVYLVLLRDKGVEVLVFGSF